MYVPDRDGILWKLHNNFYFILALRAVSVLLTVITLFICISSEHWQDKVASGLFVIGLFFTIASFILFSCSIGVIYICQLETSMMTKRALFVLLGSLSSLASAILYLLAVNTCDQYSVRFGCFSSYLSSGMKVAAAFAFLCVLCSALDFGLQLLFHYGDSSRLDERPKMGTTITTFDVNDEELIDRRPLDISPPMIPQHFHHNRSVSFITPPDLSGDRCELSEGGFLSHPLPKFYYERKTVHTDV